MSATKQDYKLEVTLQDGTVVHGLASDYWAVAIYSYFVGGEVQERLAKGEWEAIAEIVQAKMDASAQQKTPEAEAEVAEKLSRKDTEFAKEVEEVAASLMVGKKTKKDAKAEAIALLTQRAAKNSAFRELVTALLGRSFDDFTLRKNMVNALCSIYRDLPEERYSVERTILNPQIRDLTMLLIEAIAKGFERELQEMEPSLESITVGS